MNKKPTPKISNILIGISLSTIILSLIIMFIKSFFIIKNLEAIDNTKIKWDYLQNFKYNSEFEELLNNVNPSQIDNLLDYYKLDYFFMVGYFCFLLLTIYKSKYFWMNKYSINSFRFHFFHLVLAILVSITFTIDVLENWQLIYQTKYLNSDLIESCMYNFRYWAKYFTIAIPLLYVLINIIFLRYFKK
jgi:hypothetical protein